MSHDADVGDHGEEHLADVLGLAVFAVGELNFVDFGDAIDDVGDLIAEAGGDFLAGDGGVFDGVVEEAGGDGSGVKLHFGQDFSDFEGMDDVGLARSTLLSGMMLDAEFPGLADERDIFAGPVGLHVAKQRLDSGIDLLLGDFWLGRERRSNGHGG